MQNQGNKIKTMVISDFGSRNCRFQRSGSDGGVRYIEKASLTKRTFQERGEKDDKILISIFCSRTNTMTTTMTTMPFQAIQWNAVLIVLTSHEPLNNQWDFALQRDGPFQKNALLFQIDLRHP